MSQTQVVDKVRVIEDEYYQTGRIPNNLSIADVEHLTRQKVVGFQERKHEIVFQLESGINFYIRKW